MNTKEQLSTVLNETKRLCESLYGIEFYKDNAHNLVFGIMDYSDMDYSLSDIIAFIEYSKENDIEDSTVLETIIHDIYNRGKDFFEPRTFGYSNKDNNE